MPPSVGPPHALPPRHRESEGERRVSEGARRWVWRDIERGKGKNYERLENETLSLTIYSPSVAGLGQYFLRGAL